MKNIFSKYKSFEPLVQVYISKYAEDLNKTILTEDEFRELIFLYAVEAFKLFQTDADRADKAYNYVNERIEKALSKYKRVDN